MSNKDIIETYHKNGLRATRVNKTTNVSERWYISGLIYTLVKSNVDVTRGLQTGYYESYYNNGNKYFKYTYLKYKLHGIQYEWNKEGNITSKRNFIYNKSHGLHEHWIYSFDNKTLVYYVKCNYLNGKKNGLYEKYDNNGNLLNSTFHINKFEL